MVKFTRLIVVYAIDIYRLWSIKTI